MNDVKGGIRVVSMPQAAGALLVVAVVATWAFWPLGEIVHADLPPPDPSAATTTEPGPAFPLDGFQSAMLWPPRIRKTEEKKPAPAKTNERRFQDLSLLGIVATTSGPRAVLYSKQDDRTVEIGAGESIGPFRIERVDSISVDVTRGSDQATLRLERGPRTLAGSAR